MSKKILLLASAFLAAFVLNACAADPPKPTAASPLKHPPTKSCNDKDPECKLTITVSSCTPAGIVIDHASLGVLYGSRDVKIDWVITTPGYGFKDDGIKFKTDGWQKEFDQPKADKNKFRWRDRNNAGGARDRVYSYGITIVKADGSPCATLDPDLVNDH
jgi:hypothetical protein